MTEFLVGFGLGAVLAGGGVGVAAWMYLAKIRKAMEAFKA